MTPESADIQPVGTGLSRDISNGEAVEADLNRLIERRSRQRDADEENELWQESVRAYEEQRRRVARLEWHLHHTEQAERLRRTLEALASHHEEQAAKLTDVQPKGAA
jgi:ABC-type phosphonate transport system ATPase subunit